MMESKKVKGQVNPKCKLSVLEEIRMHITQACKLFTNSSNSN